MFLATMRVLVAVAILAQAVAAQSPITGLLRPGDRLRIDSLGEGRLVSATPDSFVVTLEGGPRGFAVGQGHSVTLALDHRHAGSGALIGTLFGPGPGTLVGLGIGAAWKSSTWVALSPPRVRLESYEWGDRIGSLTSVSTSAIGLRTDGTDASFPKRSVHSVSISTGQHPRTRFGASIGAPIGALAALLVVGSTSRGELDDLGVAVGSLVVGGASGAIVGGLIGRRHTREGWTELSSSRWR